MSRKLDFLAGFRKIIRDHGGHYAYERAEPQARGWWDAYGDLTACHIAFGRLLELTKGSKGVKVLLLSNHVLLVKRNEQELN